MVYELLLNIMTKIQNTGPDNNDTILEEIYRKNWLVNKPISPRKRIQNSMPLHIMPCGLVFIAASHTCII